MRSSSVTVPVAVLALAGLAPAAVAQAPPGADPLADQVRTAIDSAVGYLRQQEAGRSNFENGIEAQGYPGGPTALATFALLTAGVPPDDPMIQRCLAQVRQQPVGRTYVVALQAMAFAAAGENQDRERIQKRVDWLLGARHRNGNRLLGWTYGLGGGVPDNSNTQYALLGLHEGQQAGARIDPEVWQEIRDYYTRQDRGKYLNWGYHAGGGYTPTMTASALCGMLIAGMDLRTGRETLGPDAAAAARCGQYEDNRDVAACLDLVGRQLPRDAFAVGRGLHPYYYLYCLERAGRLSGQRFFAHTDWYRLGCEFLVRRQNQDGSFLGEGSPVIGTSFALLFLAKGRTPVLLSKLVHGLPNQGPEDADWDNDRNDARHLVAFVSRELFQKKPLAWQVFDARQAGELGEDRQLNDVTAQLLQSPVAYFNGHRAPHFTGGEEQMLRRYVENGGFIFAEACCGQEAFDKGFRTLMTRIFPNATLQRLPREHPIWTASGKFHSDPNRFDLWGLNMGCKTVVVYSRHDLSCRWESNQLDDNRVRAAFELGANVIAYATGMEAPKPRLTEVPVFTDDRDRRFRRGYLKVAQIRHGGDWQPAPQAMPNLMQELRKQGLDVSLRADEVRPGDRSFTDYKFLYMHGRNPFAFSPEEIQRLHFNLENGALLLADACCGSKSFDQSFRQMIKVVWPGRALQPVPPDDELFSKELNGAAITAVQCRREGPNGRPDPRYRSVPPQLEGVKVNGRWAVIYSKYDIGCALENRPSVDCLGHDHASAVALAKAAVLYALRR